MSKPVVNTVPRGLCLVMSSRHLTCVLCSRTDWKAIQWVGCRSGRSQFTEKATSDLNTETAQQFPVDRLYLTELLEDVKQRRINTWLVC